MKKEKKKESVTIILNLESVFNCNGMDPWLYFELSQVAHLKQTEL